MTMSAAHRCNHDDDDTNDITHIFQKVNNVFEKKGKKKDAPNFFSLLLLMYRYPHPTNTGIGKRSNLCKPNKTQCLSFQQTKF